VTGPEHNGDGVFPSNETDDPVLARSDRLIRWGGLLPWLGLALAGLTGWLLRPSTGTFVACMLCVAAVGQLLVWSGMNGLRRCRGWAFDGVLFYVWVSGILSAAAVASTGVLVLTLIPLAAPTWATFARWRNRKVRG
jgi:hypothetical protein